MSHGIEVRGASGQIKYDSESKTMRAVDSIVLPENSSSSTVINNYDSSLGFETVFIVSPGNNTFSYNFDNSSKILSWVNNTPNPVLIELFEVR